MERLSRVVSVCGLALAIVPAGLGCRSTKSEVPPGRSFTSDGKPTDPLNFGGRPNPSTAPPYTGMPNATSPYGVPNPNSNPYNPYNGNGSSFGPPGSTNLSNSSPAKPSTGTQPSAAGMAAPDLSPPTAPASIPSQVSGAGPKENGWSADPTVTTPQPPGQSPFQ